MKQHRPRYFFTVMMVLLSACVIEKEDTTEENECSSLHCQPVSRLTNVMDRQKPKNSQTLGRKCQPSGRKLEKRSCAAGLLCVPDSANEREGTCLYECGEKKSSVLEKNHARCPEHLRCMRKKNKARLTIGMFCLPVQNEAHKPCEAPFDEDACSKGLMCLPVSENNYQCKEECTEEKKCSNAKEQCFLPPYARLLWQQDKDHKKVPCDADLCQKNVALCPCDSLRGFFCQKEQHSSNGRCLRKVGVCGQI